MGRETLWRRIFIAIRFFFIYLYCLIAKDLPRMITLKPKSVVNQVIVITGGSMGIGKGLARKFALQEHAIVCILDIDEIHGEKTVEEIRNDGGRAYFFRCDVRIPNNIRSCAQQIQNDPKIGDVDIVICNAAVLRMGTILEMSDEDFQITMDVDVLGYIHTIRAFLPTMIAKNRGQVVAIASICSYFGENHGTAYCTAKFAVRGLMDSLQMELDEKCKRGIAVTTIFPYFTETTFVSNHLVDPFCTFVDVIPFDECVNEIVDAILKERVSCYIPRIFALLVFIRWTFMTKCIVPQARKMMNVQYVLKPKPVVSNLARG